MRPVACAMLLTSVALTGCAHTPADDPADPLEPVNRKIFAFNRTVDTYAVKPVAKTYRTWFPAPIRRGVSNFLDNLFYPTTIVNDALQGKIKQTGMDLGRFTMNTTIGLLGVLDVATPVGLPEHNEDLGQTFGTWGLGQGWYLMLPILGPSDNRDFVGYLGDTWMGPTSYFDTVTALSITVTKGIDKRTALLDGDKYIDEALDPYIALRTIYLQHRLSVVYDGAPPQQKIQFDE